MARISFLPMGTHIIRFFSDPTDHQYRLAIVHRIDGHYVLCPTAPENNIADAPQSCFICGQAALTDDYKLFRRVFCMMYGNLIDTTAEEESYWQGGSIYCIIGSRPLEEFISSHRGDLNQIVAPPKEPGQVTRVVFGRDTKHGRKRKISMSPAPGYEKSIVGIGKWYDDLSTYIVPERFDPEEFEKVGQQLVESQSAPKKRKGGRPRNVDILRENP